MNEYTEREEQIEDIVYHMKRNEIRIIPGKNLFGCTGFGCNNCKMSNNDGCTIQAYNIPKIKELYPELFL